MRAPGCGLVTRKYFRTIRPSRARKGAPQLQHVIWWSIYSHSGSPSARTSSYPAPQCGHSKCRDTSLAFITFSLPAAANYMRRQGARCFDLGQEKFGGEVLGAKTAARRSALLEPRRSKRQRSLRTLQSHCGDWRSRVQRRWTPPTRFAQIRACAPRRLPHRRGLSRQL
jgi:hypothetical protein